MFKEPKYKPRRLSKKQRQQLEWSRSVRAKAQAERKQRREQGEGTFSFSYSAPRRGSDVSTIPSKSDIPVHQPQPQQKLDGEMLEREKLAQLEIERKKQCVAPAYNKGAYQYVGSPDQAKDIGK